MAYADSLTNPFGVKVNFHIYETHKANAKPEEKLIKKVDIGIGLSHFHQTTLENGLSGIIGEFWKILLNSKKGDKIYSRLPIDKIGAFALGAYPRS